MDKLGLIRRHKIMNLIPYDGDVKNERYDTTNEALVKQEMLMDSVFGYYKGKAYDLTQFKNVLSGVKFDLEGLNKFERVGHKEFRKWLLFLSSIGYRLSEFETSPAFLDFRTGTDEIYEQLTKLLEYTRLLKFKNYVAVFTKGKIPRNYFNITRTNRDQINYNLLIYQILVPPSATSILIEALITRGKDTLMDYDQNNFARLKQAYSRCYVKKSYYNQPQAMYNIKMVELIKLIDSMFPLGTTRRSDLLTRFKNLSYYINDRMFKLSKKNLGGLLGIRDIRQGILKDEYNKVNNFLIEMVRHLRHGTQIPVYDMRPVKGYLDWSGKIKTIYSAYSNWNTLRHRIYDYAAGYAWLWFNDHQVIYKSGIKPFMVETDNYKNTIEPEIDEEKEIWVPTKDDYDRLKDKEKFDDNNRMKYKEEVTSAFRDGDYIQLNYKGYDINDDGYIDEVTRKYDFKAKVGEDKEQIRVGNEDKDDYDIKTEIPFNNGSYTSDFEAYVIAPDILSLGMEYELGKLKWLYVYEIEVNDRTEHSTWFTGIQVL